MSAALRLAAGAAIVVVAAGVAWADARAAQVRLETVTYARDSVTFTATLARPAGRARVPAVVLLHGSEPGRRDSPNAQRLRDRLVPRGVAVLSFDKRGVGDSGGRYREMPDLEEAARDGLAAVRWLRTRRDIDPARIGVIGASQGGWIGPLMAARSPDVAFVVSLSGPGVTPREQNRFMDGARLLEAGLDAAAVAEVDALRDALIAYWEHDTGADSIAGRWRAAIERPWFDVAAKDDPLFSRIGRGARPPSRRQMPAEYLEMLAYGRYDPVATAAQVHVPVLHVYGEADRHVPVAASVERLRPAYARGGNRDVTFLVLPHAGHGLQLVDGDAECLRCRDATPLRFAPGATDAIDRWILERVTRRGPR